ncbi:MAG: hypothetical protein ABIO04_08260 [Ferruginibacter sp.]
MRRILLVSICLFVGNILKAQLTKVIPASAAFADSLSRVAQDFRYNYYNIQSELIISQNDMETFQSNISLPGSKNCLIYRFHSTVDTTAAWQATMYQGESYRDALKAYKNTCRQVERSKLHLGSSIAGFTGRMDEPDPNVRFVSSEFKLNSKEEAFSLFYAEVEMILTGMEEWEVHLNLHNKKDDEDK